MQVTKLFCFLVSFVFSGSEQSSDILFVPGPDPQLVTVEGGGVITPFVLDPGTWTVTIEAPEGVLLVSRRRGCLAKYSSVKVKVLRKSWKFGSTRGLPNCGQMHS